MMQNIFHAKTPRRERSNPGFPPAARRGGWTLVEMLVVMVLMVIILSMALPAFIGMGRGSGLRGAVSSVQSSLAFCRQWAITHKEPVSLVCVSSTSTSAASLVVINAYGQMLQPMQKLPLGININSAATIAFKSDGGLDDDGNPTIVLEDQTGVAKNITVYRITGGIRVQ